MTDPVPPNDAAKGGGLEITITRKPVDQKFGPEGKDNLGAGAAPGVGGNRPDDASVDYLLQRQQRDAADLDHRAREKYGVPLPAQGDQPDATQPTPPAAPPAAGTKFDPGTGMPPQGMDAVDPELLNKPVGQALKDSGSAVMREATHAPVAAAAGVGSAASELFTAADTMAEWITKNVVDLNVPIPLTGSETVDELLARPGKAIAKMIDAITPTAGESATAPMIKSTAQFLTGMWLGGKLFKGIGAMAEGAGGARGAAIKALGTGAVSDALMMDPKEENLAAYLKTVPALQKVVPDFLATKPDDNEAVNRLRKAVEGLGLGAATEGLMAAFRAYRAARAAKAVEKDPAKAALLAQEAKYGKLTKEDLAKLLGDTDPEAPLVAARERAAGAVELEVPDAAELAARAADPARQAVVKAEPKPGRGTPEGGGVAVNWSKISTADDVKVAMRELADLNAARIEEARRGKISHEETKQLAQELGLTVDELLARRAGQALNAEQTQAARQLLSAAAERTVTLARVVATPNAGPVELFAYRRAVATEAAILEQVMGARAEAGRALNAWKIPAASAGDVERSKAILEALEAAGPNVEKVTREIAGRHAILADSGAAAADLHNFVEAAAPATKWQAVQEAFVNGLLTSPKTHLVNAASNTLAMAQQIIERGIAEKLAALGRAEGAPVLGVAPGEAAAMISAVVAAQKDAWKVAWLSLRSGETGHALGKVDQPHVAAFNARTFEMQDNALAKTVDYLGATTRTPTRLLGAADEYFKAIGYRMEVHAQAVRQATAEGLEGVALRERVADLIEHPPESIRLEAMDAAMYQTFTNHAGAAAEALVKLREAWPATVFLLPFVRTPVNIARYGFERTPLAFAMSGVRADLAHGGARRELALARIGTGTSIMLAAADYADRGLITGKGPNDPARREALMRQGWRPYSVRVGDKWVEYQRADPYGMLMGFAADMAEINRTMEIDGDKLDEFSELWAAGVAAISGTVISKTYMKGMADFFWMMEDPQRRAFGYLGGEVGSIVPAGVAFAKGIDDPVMRENMKIWDYVQGRLPGFSKDLTPSRDLWGKERQNESGYGPGTDAINPFRIQKIVDSPIDREMQRLNMGVERIDKKSAVEGVMMNFRDWPEVYDRYVVLAGNGLKHPAWRLGAKDYLDSIVEGRSPLSAVYKKMSDGPEGEKADFIKATIRDYRKLAQAAILADPHYADFRVAWRDQQKKQADAKGTFGGVQRPAVPDVRAPAPGSSAPPSTLSPMQVP